MNSFVLDGKDADLCIVKQRSTTLVLCCENLKKSGKCQNEGWRCVTRFVLSTEALLCFCTKPDNFILIHELMASAPSG